MEQIQEELAGHGYCLGYVRGQGATARVYCVKSIKNGRNYACKAGRPDLLWQEYQLMSCCEHPLFPGAGEFWRGEEKGFLIMEYLWGSSLTDCLRRRNYFSWREAVRMAVELAGGLAALHEGNPPAVYRDLKPSNIIIQPDSRVRLMDLGALLRLPDTVHGKATFRETAKDADRSGAARISYRAGTPGFSAPEQFEQGKTVDERADVYALGKVLCYMVTGRLDGEGVLPRVQRLPGGLRRVLEDCVQPEPGSRIPDMRQVIRELSRYISCQQTGGGGGGRPIFKGSTRSVEFRYEKNIVRNSHRGDT